MESKESFGYFSKTVAERIEVSKDTIRSWSLKLEAEGATFERNNRSQRIYFEKDMRTFQNMKELLDLNHPLDNVAKTIAEKMENGIYDREKSQNHDEITPSVIQQNHELITLNQQMEKVQETLIREITEKQNQQLEQFKNELAKSMAAKMQDVLDETVKHAVETALLKERKEIAKEVMAQMEQAADGEKKVPFYKKWFR